MFKKREEKQFSIILDDFRAELDDHLAAINENTNEIQSNFEYVSEINSKIDKLAQRIDQIQLFLNMNKTKHSKISPLSLNEKKVFVALYTLAGQDNFLTYKDLAVKANLPEEIIAECVTTMLIKGVPIQKKFVNNIPIVALENNFRELQAKEMVIKLDLNTK